MKTVIRKTLRTSLSFVLGCCMAAGFLPVRAEEDETVYDLRSSADEESIEEFGSYKDAAKAFDEIRDDYDNLLLYRDDVLVKAEYAAAVFETDDACEYTVAGRRQSDGKSVNINGCYGADALYLETDDSGEEALIMISGMKGYVSLYDITLIPSGSLETTLSSYTVNDGTLFHQIKTQMDSDLYSNYIRGGSAPAGIGEGDTVYSYDGHYFYSDFNAMSDDVRSGEYDQALNSEAYYDYFQFLPHRSLSLYGRDDFQHLFNDIYGFHAAMDTFSDQNLDGMDDTVNRSQLYGTADALIGFQNRYGANALLALGLSELESSYGRSYYAFTKNNLFEHAAYDTDQELENNRFDSVNRSLYSHAKYFVSGSYCSPLKDEYQGGFFGNLASGMNVFCSSDPYWGEKAASFTRQADLFLGKKDLSAYTVGIKTSDEKMQIYRQANKTEGALYNSPASPDYAVIILGEEGDFYKIQSDSTLTDELTDISYDYDFAGDIGYVLKSDISHVETGSSANTSAPEIRVTFQAGEGSFSDGESEFTAYFHSGDIPSCEAPVLYESEFSGWDREPSAVTEDTEYTAVYRQIDSVEIGSMPRQDYEINDRPDLQDGTLIVHYTDGEDREIPVTPEMISGFDLSANGDQAVTVSYCGHSADYGIHVSAEQDAVRNDIKTQIEEIIREYGDAEEIDEEAAGRILAVKKSVDDQFLPYLTQSQLRVFDQLVHRASRDRILLMVSENNMGFGISGVSLNLSEKNTGEVRVCQINVSEAADDENRKTVADTAAGMNYALCSTVSFTVSENDEPVTLNHPVICSVDKPAGNEAGTVYRVYRLDPDGDITECLTRLSQNKISFMTDRTGDFYIASRLTSNVIDYEDPVESVTYETSDEMPPIEEIHPNFPYGMAAVSVLGIIALFLLGRMIYLKFYRKRRRQERIDREKEIKDIELTTMKLELGDIELWTETHDRRKWHDKHNRSSH